MNKGSAMSEIDSQQKIRPNLVKELGLSFPYAWSNRYAPAEAVISDALRRPDFEDLVKLMAHFGPEKMHEMKGFLIEQGELGGAALANVERMLSNIEIGIRSANARRH